MRINQTQLNEIYCMLWSPQTREILNIIHESEPIRFTDVVKKLNRGNNNAIFGLRKLVKTNCIKNESKLYFLTRYGLEVIKLINGFESACMEYDLNDCDTHGKLVIVVKRNQGLKQ